MSMILTFHLLCLFSFHTLLWPDVVAVKQLDRQWMSRSSMSEDIQVFTGLEIHVHSMHIMRISS